MDSPAAPAAAAAASASLEPNDPIVLVDSSDEEDCKITNKSGVSLEAARASTSAEENEEEDDEEIYYFRAHFLAVGLRVS